MSAVRATGTTRPNAREKAICFPGEVVLELQGGGALGAYQLGVYQAMHEAGIVPDWVVGTSIGAINAVLIAGNAPENRLTRLHEFWDCMEIRGLAALSSALIGAGNTFANLLTVTHGLPAFFRPNPMGFLGWHAQLGIERAAYYSTDPLRETLNALVDWNYLLMGEIRLTVGAVNARTGEMRYFDNRTETLTVDHIMASGALPPAFPAVRIDGEPYWDGSIYSNTPLEVVFNENPRRSSVIFAVQLWNPRGDEPASLWQIQDRIKEIQFASSCDNHVAAQQKIHRLRQIIHELANHVSAKDRNSVEVAELADWGCGTTMHLVRLRAPRLEGEDHTRDIDFTRHGIHARWAAGHKDGKRAIQEAPWQLLVDPCEGIVVHELS